MKIWNMVNKSLKDQLIATTYTKKGVTSLFMDQ